MSALATSLHDGLGHVALNRPEVRNPMNLAKARELTALLDDSAGKSAKKSRGG